jgi:hypothetical protein
MGDIRMSDVPDECTAVGSDDCVYCPYSSRCIVGFFDTSKDFEVLPPTPEELELLEGKGDD